MTTWYSTDDEAALNRLIAAWPDAPVELEEVLELLVDVARQQVTAYGPAEELYVLDEDGEPTSVPRSDVDDRFVYAQLQQATNLWNAGRVSPDGEAGEGSYSYTPRPLDKTIRATIRPITGVPLVL